MESYLSQREELIRAAEPGVTSAQRLARLTDELLSEMATSAAREHMPDRTRWSLLALGGYGSGALLPASDLDVLLLTDGRPEKLRPFVEALLYPLWDAGLKVGHQVRSRRDQVKAIREDLATLTATLTGRVIVGDERLGEDTLRACAADAGKRAAEVLAEMHGRSRPDSPYALEPQLKEGAGGRRDFDELTWIAALRSSSTQADPSLLVELGLLTRSEMASLLDASQVISAARWELQVAGAGDRMDEDSAGEIVSDPGKVQEGLAATHHLLLRVRERLAGNKREGARALSSQEVIESLSCGIEGLNELEAAAWEGRLDPLIPGFKSLMTLRRPGLAHALTVGAHSLRTAALAAEIVSDTGTVALDDVARASARSCEETPALLVAALIHDTGKTEPGPGHESRGAQMAIEVASAFDLAERADHIADLVKHHLLLAQTASSQDLDDEQAVLAVADVLENRALLAPLHVLTIADSVATGPSAWTDWHGALVGKLVVQLDAALCEGVSGAGIAVEAEALRERILADLPEGDSAAAFIIEASTRYLARHDAVEILRHAEQSAQISTNSIPGAKAIEISVGPVPDSHRVTVIAPDSSGLLAKIAGVLALIGLDILAVDATTTTQRVAIDTFTVRSATLAAIDPTTWAKLERNLDLALRDRLAVGVRLSERRKHYPAPTSTATPRIEIEVDESGAARLRLRIADRVGLLHDVARAIGESGLDITSVTALTRSSVADDTFRLSGPGGAAADAGALGQLKMRLRELT